MKTPIPFEPGWQVTVGGVKHEGKGLLGILKGVYDLVEEMCVNTGETTIRVFPVTGTITQDGSLKRYDAKPCKLVWFRRMEAQIGTHDGNAGCRPDCLWYGLGLESDGIPVGFRIFANGQVKWGI